MTGAVAAVIALGTNLGDRVENLRAAVAAIGAVDGVTVTDVSAPVESHAVKLQGVDEQAPNYLNAIALVTTTLAPAALLDALHTIENALGRVRAERWGDRTIDLDIVSYADLRQETADLVLPHPRAGERAFVLVPWLQVDADAVLPGRGRIDGLDASHSDEVWTFAVPTPLGRIER